MAEDKKRANILGLVEAAFPEGSFVKSPGASDVAGGAVTGGKSTAYRKSTVVVPPKGRRP